MRNNLSGGKFGLLIVGDYINSKNGSYYHCICDCGKHTTVSYGNLINGLITSCGCAKKTCNGLSKTKEHSAHRDMKQRCYHKNHPHYKNYGGKGIYVCPRWLNSFLDFLEDIGNAPSEKYTLERIDSNLNYTCGHCPHCITNNQILNVTWATRHDQARNKSDNDWHTYKGETLVLKDWAIKFNIPYLTLWMRVNEYGYTFEDAVTMKKYERRSKDKKDQEHKELYAKLLKEGLNEH